MTEVWSFELGRIRVSLSIQQEQGYQYDGAIAEAIDDMSAYPGRVAGAYQVARYLACELRGTNPLFDRERFLKACGVDQPEPAHSPA